MKPPSPKADALRQMRERQAEERERRSVPLSLAKEARRLFTNTEIETIRQSGSTCRELAEVYSVSAATINRLRKAISAKAAKPKRHK